MSKMLTVDSTYLTNSHKYIIFVMKKRVKHPHISINDKDFQNLVLKQKRLLNVTILNNFVLSFQIEILILPLVK